MFFEAQLTAPGFNAYGTALVGMPVLTIAESDPGSSSEAMFALTFKPAGLSFRMNIDAISRSGLKVDPRVLRVAKSGG